MEQSNSGTATLPVTILDDTELLSLVIEKHKKFIHEYDDEHNNLQENVKAKRLEYQRINTELETLETRIVVLTEKRHQLYHQAKKLRSKLFDSITDRKPIEHLGQEMENIENRLQNATLSSVDECRHIDRLHSLLEEIPSTVLGDDARLQMTVSSINDILEMAKTAREELDDVVSTPDTYKIESISMKKEFDEKEARMGWLNNRIQLHKEALSYWETIKMGGGHTE